jgi:hypothetical protein
LLAPAIAGIRTPAPLTRSGFGAPPIERELQVPCCERNLEEEAAPDETRASRSVVSPVCFAGEVGEWVSWSLKRRSIRGRKLTFD